MPAHILPDQATLVFIARVHQTDRRYYLGHRYYSNIMKMSPATFSRRLRGQGRFTTEQLYWGNQLLAYSDQMTDYRQRFDRNKYPTT